MGNRSATMASVRSRRRRECRNQDMQMLAIEQQACLVALPHRRWACGAT